MKKRTKLIRRNSQYQKEFEQFDTLAKFNKEDIYVVKTPLHSIKGYIKDIDVLSLQPMYGHNISVEFDAVNVGDIIIIGENERILIENQTINKTNLMLHVTFSHVFINDHFYVVQPKTIIDACQLLEET